MLITLYYTLLDISSFSPGKYHEFRYNFIGFTVIFL